MLIVLTAIFRISPEHCCYYWVKTCNIHAVHNKQKNRLIVCGRKQSGWVFSWVSQHIHAAFCIYMLPSESLGYSFGKRVWKGKVKWRKGEIWHKNTEKKKPEVTVENVSSYCQLQCLVGFCQGYVTRWIHHIIPSNPM